MITPYKDSADPKVDQVRRMFNRIAPQYDRLNLVISLGLDRSWRRKALSFPRTLCSEARAGCSYGYG